MLVRQMSLWDVRRFEERRGGEKTVVLVWVAYNGNVINREYFKYIKVDRNGKVKGIK